MSGYYYGKNGRLFMTWKIGGDLLELELLPFYLAIHEEFLR